MKSTFGSNLCIHFIAILYAKHPYWIDRNFWSLIKWIRFCRTNSYSIHCLWISGVSSREIFILYIFEGKLSLSIPTKIQHTLSSFLLNFFYHFSSYILFVLNLFWLRFSRNENFGVILIHFVLICGSPAEIVRIISCKPSKLTNFE